MFEELSGKPVKNEIMIWDVGPFWIPLSHLKSGSNNVLFPPVFNFTNNTLRIVLDDYIVEWLIFILTITHFFIGTFFFI